jgi:hypothetical protein
MPIGRRKKHVSRRAAEIAEKENSWVGFAQKRLKSTFIHNSKFNIHNSKLLFYAAGEIKKECLSQSRRGRRERK